MRRFRLQVFFGLFFSAFIRFGICFLFFVIGMLLSPVNKMFFYFGIACLIFEVVVALADAIRCMSAAKNANSGNPDVDEVFKVIFTDDYDDPEVELAKALTKLTGGCREYLSSDRRRDEEQNHRENNYGRGCCDIPGTGGIFRNRRRDDHFYFIHREKAG